MHKTNRQRKKKDTNTPLENYLIGVLSHWIPAEEKKKPRNIEEAMESGAEQQPLYTVLPEKRVNVGAAMMGSAHVYDMASVSLTKGFSN